MVKITKEVKAEVAARCDKDACKAMKFAHSLGKTVIVSGYKNIIVFEADNLAICMEVSDRDYRLMNVGAEVTLMITYLPEEENIITKF